MQLLNTLSTPFLVLEAYRLLQNLLSRNAGSSDHNSLVQMLWIFNLLQIFSIQCLMKCVVNENSISRCLVCFPFNQIYTTKVCRNYPSAVIKFVELQGRTFFSFISIFKKKVFGHRAF